MARSIAVFTAIDGSLLGSPALDAGENREAVQRLHGSGIDVIPITVMTLEEIRPVVADLGLRGPMIIEAGGAIARRWNGEWHVEACGLDADLLLDAIAEIENRSGARLAVYSVLPEPDAAILSGRRGEMLAGSIHRQFSEPFVVESGNIAAVEQAADSLGFSLRRGRRFFYLSRRCDEGSAFTRVRAELRIDYAIGVGGSPIDIEFLSRVDVAVIIPGAGGEPDGELVRALPNAFIAPAPAPDGWATAVERVLSEIGTAYARAGGAA